MDSHKLKLFIALAVYDTILSFPKEIKCIWQGKFGTGPILYLFIRYGTVFNMLLELLEVFPSSRTVIVSNISIIVTFH